jgi:hypothetical protein
MGRFAMGSSALGISFGVDVNVLKDAPGPHRIMAWKPGAGRTACGIVVLWVCDSGGGGFFEIRVSRLFVRLLRYGNLELHPSDSHAGTDAEQSPRRNPARLTRAPAPRLSTCVAPPVPSPRNNNTCVQRASCRRPHRPQHQHPPYDALKPHES